MSTFCQLSYHRKCQRRGIGGQKKPKSCQCSLWMAQINETIMHFHGMLLILIGWGPSMLLQKEAPLESALRYRETEVQSRAY